MRCLALAQAWQSTGGRVVFVQAQGTESLRQQLRDAGCAVERIEVEPGSQADATETAWIAAKHDARLITADGYVFGPNWQRTVKAQPVRLLILDDLARQERYFADWVLNQNLHARAESYSNSAPGATLLLGTQYTLLRRSFLRWLEWERATPRKAVRLVITFGGSDPAALTEFALNSLRAASPHPFQVTLIVGGSNPRRQHITALAADCDAWCRVGVDVRDMAFEFANAEIALTSGGSACWELAFMGVPALGIAFGPQEERLLAEVHLNGNIEMLGSSGTISAAHLIDRLVVLSDDWQRRRHMSQVGRNLIDGRGAERVVKALQGCAI